MAVNQSEACSWRDFGGSRGHCIPPKATYHFFFYITILNNNPRRVASGHYIFLQKRNFDLYAIKLIYTFLYNNVLIYNNY